MWSAAVITAERAEPAKAAKASAIDYNDGGFCAAACGDNFSNNSTAAELFIRL